MTRLDLINHIEAQGFVKPTRGNSVDCRIKDVDGKTYRYKLTKIGVRLEVKVIITSPYSPKKTEWVRIKSGYLSQLYFNSEGNIVGLKR